MDTEGFLAAMAKGPNAHVFNVSRYSSRTKDTLTAPLNDGPIVVDDAGFGAQPALSPKSININPSAPESAARPETSSPERPGTRDHIQECQKLEERMRADRKNPSSTKYQDEPRGYKVLEDKMWAREFADQPAHELTDSSAEPMTSNYPHWNAEVEEKMKAYRPINPPKPIAKDYPQWYTNLEDKMKVYRSSGGVDTKNPRETQSYSPIPPEYAKACIVARDSIKEVLENYSPKSRSSSSKETSPQRKVSKLNLSVRQPSSPSDLPTKPETRHDEAPTLLSPPGIKHTSSSLVRNELWIAPHLRIPKTPEATTPPEHKPDAPDIKPVTLPTKIEDEPNRDKGLYFSSWGTPQQRERAAARTRKVILTSTPPFDNPSPQLIASLVFDGPLEQILTTSNSASVTFLHADDCQKYFNATGNGIKFGKNLIADVRLSTEVDVVGGRLQALIDKEATRCVRAVGIRPENQLKYHVLEAMAKGRMTRERKVERIIKEKNARGIDSVTWRFCDIRDAEAFTTELRRDEIWEHFNIHYAPDPCALSKGVHVD